MNTPLDILIVEDNTNQQQAATEQLKEHNVTIAPNAHDAADLLAGGRHKRYEGLTREHLLRRRFDAYDRLKGTIIVQQHFDVMLTDMKLPIAIGPYHALSDPLEYEGQTFDFGYPLALLAAREGVPLIGIISDTNHHNDPMTTMYRYFKIRDVPGSDTRYEPVTLRLNNSILKVSDDASLLRINNEYASNYRSSSHKEGDILYEESMYRRIDGTTFTITNRSDQPTTTEITQRDGKTIYHKNWYGLLHMLLKERAQP